MANSGEEALRLGESFQPALIIMDIGMPGMDGYGACQRIRACQWGERIRLVALTGWGQDDDRKRSEEAGFNQHLVKPVDRATLLRVLAEA